MVTFNPRLTQILSKVSLSKNMQLKLTTYCNWAFSLRYSYDNTKCYSMHRKVNAKSKTKFQSLISANQPLRHQLRRRLQQQKWQKRNRFRLARFMCLSSRHCTITTWNCLISRFVEDSNTVNHFLFLFFNLDTVLKNSTLETFANIWRIEQDGIKAIKLEATRIPF